MVKTPSLSLTNVRLESRDGGCVREIDNAYHLYMAAQTTSQVTPLLLAALNMQASQGAIALRMLQEPGQAGREGVSPELSQNIRSIISGMERLQHPKKLPSLGGVDAGILPDNSASFMYQRPATDVETSEKWARQILRQQRILVDIAENIRKSYDAHYLEIRNEADRWFMSGLGRTGRDRDEDWTDAMRMLQALVESQVGMQDYVAWFQIGWLLWKHKNNLPQAEEAFYRAQRLSADRSNFYHVLSLRHFAYLQYLQGRHEGAYQTIQKAIRLNSDHDTLFDAARYASNTSRRAETLALLGRCIRERPTTTIAMFAEVDFQIRGGFPSLIMEMTQLTSSLMHEVRVRLDQNSKQWQNAIHIVNMTQQQAEVRITLPPILTLGPAELANQIRDADYISLLDFDKNILSYADHTFRLGRAALKEEATKRQAEVANLEREIDSVQHQFQVERRVESVHKAVFNKHAESEMLQPTKDYKAVGIICFVLGIGADVAFTPNVMNFLGLKHGPFSKGLQSSELFFLYAALSWFIAGLLLFAVIRGLNKLISPAAPRLKPDSAEVHLSPEQVRRHVLEIGKKIETAKASHQKVVKAIEFLDTH